MGGLALQADSGHWCVVTGAEARVTVDGRPVGCGMPFFVEPDTTVAVGAPTRGLRSYLAVSGGLATPSLLRSRSEDTLGRIVPLPIEAGAVLPVGPSGWLPRLDQLLLPVAPGPRRDWLEDSSGLPSRPSPSPVSSKLDRIGVRFEGPALTRSVTRTLPSEGLIRGAVQLPPSGDPIVLLADHPTTRGYPVIAVVDDATTDLLAQVTPGQSVRFIDAAS
jgi:allophanate hydrolase subunit 2